MFLFLIVLMALRGLAGNAMAAGMLPAVGTAAHAAHAAAEPRSGTPPAHTLHTAAPSDAAALAPCHGEATAPSAEAAQAPHGGAGDASPHTSHHAHDGGCSACGICHSAMLTPPLADPARTALPRAPLPLAERRFASALTAQAIKPPIS
ncbi:hypothetical protein [Acidovorax sp. SUPP2539]|uniref:hypothetical protein n=1 Tax=Acidovorax sp. SUPP2539 TaxID=2920878 RepID=UPI0023DE5373|nr:hypothetical protein [Acidovorax sp. SUPP2539]GKS90791.1 hypothetical protein AVTE2539_15520 [Acidovorax sp. SUPP2539]